MNQQVSHDVQVNAGLFLQDLNDGLRTPEGLQEVQHRMEETLTSDQVENCVNYQAIQIALEAYSA